MSPTEALAALRREAEEAAMHGPQCPRCAVLRKALALVAQVVEERSTQPDKLYQHEQGSIRVNSADNMSTAYIAGCLRCREPWPCAFVRMAADNATLRAEADQHDEATIATRLLAADAMNDIALVLGGRLNESERAVDVALRVKAELGKLRAETAGLVGALKWYWEHVFNLTHNATEEDVLLEDAGQRAKRALAPFPSESGD